MLVALGATVTIAGSGGTREMPLERFFHVADGGDSEGECIEGWGDRDGGGGAGGGRDEVDVCEV